MIVPIKSFSEIQLKRGSLVVLDIDDTLLTYANLSQKWWQDEINKNYLDTMDYAMAKKRAVQEWKRLMMNSSPISLDTHNRDAFIQNLYKLGCELIFLTARDDDLAEITRSNLRDLNIYDGQMIYFDENKGRKIVEIMTIYNKYDNIIVVDDLIQNLLSIQESVQNNASEKHFQLYHINHET
jgi:hypothetical protein